MEQEKLCNKKLKLVFISVFIVMISCSANVKSKTAANESGQAVNTEIKNPLNMDFAFKLFKTVEKSQPELNTCISPFSVSMALGMCSNGARGETAEEIKQLLYNREFHKQVFNRSVKNYLDSLTHLDHNVKLEIGNSIWIRQEFPVADQFIEENREYYNARVENLDFNKNEAVEKINNWVAKSTNNKIEEIVQPPLDAQTIMFLINAIYFNGKWTNQFDPKRTKQDVFYTTDSAEVDCQMMRIKEDFIYFENDGMQIIDLPYGQKKFSMTIVLPRKIGGLDSILTSLSGEKWQQWVDKMSKQEVRLFLPKFKMDYKIKLNQVLIELGMPAAFDPDRSNFAGINKEYAEKIYIDQVLHKTFLEVDEKGTEAAAVTSARMTVTSTYPPKEPVIMRIDHPFLFAIRERQTGNVLFIGKIGNP
jgi:serpin B